MRNVCQSDEAMCQLLDAPERIGDVHVRGDDLLHRQDLVQLFRRDRLLEDPLEQQPCQHEHDPDDCPADGLEVRDRQKHDRHADGAGAERDDLVAQNQRFLLVHELVADEEREIEEQPAGDEVREDEQRQRRQRLGVESGSARRHRHRGPGVGAVRAHERQDLAAGVDQRDAPGAPQERDVGEQDPDVDRQRRRRAPRG
jgi:hypothetical protein